MLIMDSDGSRCIFAATLAQPPQDSLTVPLLIIAVLLAVKAFFAACEAALTEVDDRKLKLLAEKDKRAEKLAKITGSPARLLMTFSLFRVLSVIIIAVYAAVSLSPAAIGISDKLAALIAGSNKNAANIISAVAVPIIMIIPAWIIISAFTETLPKQLVLHKAEDFALRYSSIISVLFALLRPFAAAVSAITGVLLRLTGTSADMPDAVTEEEILMMVDAGNETGVIEESQRTMINNVFEFGDLTASDVMTHRTDISAAEISSSIGDVVNIAISTGFSRIPVYEDTIDRITGIINVKDLLCLIGSEDASAFELKSFMRDVCYVPESGSCDDIFKELTAKRLGMAVVLDEYGGTAGIVTTEDLVEAIVGNIRDEYDDETEDIVKIADGVYIADGTADPYKTLGSIGISIPEEGDFDTVSGFVISLLDGHIPNEDEKPVVKWDGAELAVLVTEDMVIKKLKITVPEKEKENTGIEPVE